MKKIIRIPFAPSSSALPTPSIEVVAIAQKLGQENLALTHSAFLRLFIRTKSPNHYKMMY